MLGAVIAYAVNEPNKLSDLFKDEPEPMEREREPIDPEQFEKWW